MKNNLLVLSHVVIDITVSAKPQTERSTILADRYYETVSPYRATAHV
jgi:hypothetical protein